MCTVTYLPIGNDDFILTSNRDEDPLRKTIPPKPYIENGIRIDYPKDEIAGGTWIGLSEKKRLICLLNGGFENHEREASYRMSRGLIVKQLLTVHSAVEAIKEFDFTSIEPFTIILVDWSVGLRAYELVWDGTQKHFGQLPQEPKIWSSSTLYTQEMKELRKMWFADWLLEHKNYTQNDVFRFQQDETKGNMAMALKMKRRHVETVSTTSVVKSFENTKMSYVNYIKSECLDL